VTRMDRCRWIKENWATESPIGRGFRPGGGVTKQSKTGADGMETYKFLTANVTNCSDRAERGHSIVFRDASANLPNRSEAAFHVASLTQ
jgi:hypothetical protein